MRVKIQIIAQLKYVHSSLLRSNIILKLACKTFPKEKSEITNFVSFAYGRCSDRLAKKTLIKKISTGLNTFTENRHNEDLNHYFRQVLVP